MANKEEKKVSVRYLSKLGNTRRIAEAIGEGLNVPAISIEDEPEIKEYCDILFLGGAPYANIMDPALRKYAEGLDKDLIGKVILFTTSNWSRRTVLALRKILKDKGITIEKEYFYAHMLNIDGRIEAAKQFVGKFI